MLDDTKPVDATHVDERTERGAEARQTGQLAELLACEQELEALMEQAHASARDIVEAARAATDEATANVEASLEEEADRERRRIREETQEQIRALEAAAREQVARFEAVTDERVAELAESAFRRLLAGEPPT